MNYKMVGRTVSRVLAAEALLMLPSLLICLYDKEADTARAFLLAMACAAVLAALLWQLCRSGQEEAFYAQEGFLATGLTWVMLSVMGCLPFLFSGQIPRFADAFFETVSGFTTTGASVLADVEAMSRGLLFWRSFTHWVGGMGVLVFVLAVVPKTGGAAMHLMRAESPGPAVDKFTARLGQTTRILYGLYLALTAANILFLLAGGMPAFEAVCHALGTAGTGGFGVKNDSYMSYSPYLQNVTTLFMALFGVNFGVYYLLLLRQVNKALADEELRLYLGLMAGSTLLIAANISGLYRNWGEAVRHAAFQVSSVMTTTGYATADFDQWPGFSRALLLCLMFAGACAGSTGGGMKIARLLLLCKNLQRTMRRMMRPRTVQLVKMNGRTVNEDVLNNMNAYLAAYGGILVVGFLVLSMENVSMVTNLSAVISCFNNIGPGLEAVGPACNYAGYSAFSKMTLSLLMLLGRLEIFPMLLLFRPKNWTRSE